MDYIMENHIINTLDIMAYPEEHFEEEDLEKLYSFVNDRSDPYELKVAVQALKMPVEYLDYVIFLAIGWHPPEDVLSDFTDACISSYRKFREAYPDKSISVQYLAGRVADAREVYFPIPRVKLPHFDELLTDEMLN